MHAAVTALSNRHYRSRQHALQQGVCACPQPAVLQTLGFVNNETVSKGMVKYASDLPRESVVDVAGKVWVPKEPITGCTNSQVHPVPAGHLSVPVLQFCPEQLIPASRCTTVSWRCSHGMLCRWRSTSHRYTASRGLGPCPLRSLMPAGRLPAHSSTMQAGACCCAWSRPNRSLDAPHRISASRP